MNRVLVDTSAYSAFRRGQPDVVRALQAADEVFVNPVVLGELKAGFLRGSRTARNARDLDRFLESPRVRVVEVDGSTSEYYAVIVNGLRTAGTPIPANDVWIASSAMQHGLRIVATDDHYRKIPQVLVDFFPST